METNAESRLDVVLPWVRKILPQSRCMGRHFLFHFHLSIHSNNIHQPLLINSCTCEPVPDSAGLKDNWISENHAWMPKSSEALHDVLQFRRKLQHELALHMTPDNPKGEGTHIKHPKWRMRNDLGLTSSQCTKITKPQTTEDGAALVLVFICQHFQQCIPQSILQLRISHASDMDG